MKYEGWYSLESGVRLPKDSKLSRVVLGQVPFCEIFRVYTLKRIVPRYRSAPFLIK